ncbi:hypothetical protein ACQPZ2_00965 [Nocardia pseudovaccinii]|uniref:hypothetical protein n=1 Tax=Nocardia pseudovaccinii TaxID=189540 RepID=UPI003D918530
MSSDKTEHQARNVGNGDWVVSFLAGRTLTTERAAAALQAAEELIALQMHAATLGLTALELAGMATMPCSWSARQAAQPHHSHPFQRSPR